MLNVLQLRLWETDKETFKLVCRGIVTWINPPRTKKMQPFYTLFLTHWGRDKWPQFCRWHNRLHFLKWQLLNFHSNCTDVCSGVPMTTSTIGSDNAEQPTRYYLLSSEPITAWCVCPSFGLVVNNEAYWCIYGPGNWVNIGLDDDLGYAGHKVIIWINVE